MRYRKNYLLSHSIDWYAKIGNSWTHCLSLGGLLPDKVDDITNLRQLQALINLVPDFTESSEINEAFIEHRYQRHKRMVSLHNERIEYGIRNGLVNDNQLIEEESLEEFKAGYVENFVSYARKGLCSFARYDIDQFENPSTALIVKPSENAAKQLNDFLTGILEQIAAIQTAGLDNFSLHYS